MKRVNNFIMRVFLVSIVVFLFSSYGCAFAAFTDYFVDSDYVTYNQGTVLIIDTRSSSEYAAGHIPGAINVPGDTFYFTRVEGDDAAKVLYNVPTPTEFVALANSWGLQPDTTVVAYGDDVDSDPPRLTWTLKLYGHSAAYVLDGGLPKWQYIDKYQVTKTTTLPTPNSSSNSYVITGYSSILAYKYDVLAAIPASEGGGGTVQGTVLLDTRTPGEYTGATVYTGDPRGGHIPGAIFLNWPSDVLTNNAKGVTNPTTKKVIQVLKSQTTLKTLFSSLGVKKSETIITYCEGGFRAAHVAELLLALGYPKVLNYQGSWNEWSNSDEAVYPEHTGSKP
jgi:thiosulfate/3-mercaptopyruvate sulfurtransferase